MLAFYPLILPWLTILLALLRLSRAAFVESYSCNDVDFSEYRLDTFVIDVALDEERQKLIFFMNSKVFSYIGDNSTDPIVTDVNTTTNRYTTLHVEIQFMGKTFIHENKRFCDLIAVKNTSDFRNGPRFRSVTTTTSANGFIGITPASEARHHTGLAEQGLKRKRSHNNRFKRDYPMLNEEVIPDLTKREDYTFNDTEILLSQTNNSIKAIFDNSTGALVQCPLYINDSFVLYYEADVKSHFHRLGSFAARFSVITNDDSSTVIGCNRAYITPVQSKYISNTLLIGILVLLLTTVFINFFTIINSSYQESSNPFLFTASTICNRNLLRQLDATVQRIIIYLQFALFIGGLNVQYPGFYQPLIGQIRWCALLGISLIHHSNHHHRIQADNIYVTMNTGGLKTLALYSTDQSMHDSWPNFMLCFICWLAISMAAEQIFLGVKALFDKYLLKLLAKKSDTEKVALVGEAYDTDINSYKFTFTKNLYFMVGHFLSTFMSLFAFPFLILTSYMLRVADTLNGKHIFFPNLNLMKSGAFATDTDYSNLFLPFVVTDSLATPTQQLDGYSATPVSTYLTTASGGLIRPGITTNATNSTLSSNVFSVIPTANMVLGSLSFALWICLACFFIFQYLITFRKYRFAVSNKVSKLYTSMKTILLWGFSYHHYHPNRVYFVIFDILSLFVKALIIGCVQRSGLVQVVILIVLEFVDLVLLFTIQPYYLEMTWTTLRWILPVARFCVTALCIPYIKELDVSEANRTYVAFAQLLIHVVIALVFIIQLCYCLISTICSIIKERRERKQYAQFSTMVNDSSLDDFNKQFEFQPLKSNLEPIMKTDNLKSMNQATSYEDLMLQNNNQNTTYEASFNQANADDEDEDEDEDVYYRGTNKHLYKSGSDMKRDLSGKTLRDAESTHNSIYHDDDTDNTSDAQSSFYRLQQRSNVRKRQIDYTFREADLIYRKYFVDAAIDPEIKALWESRHWDVKAPDVESDGHPESPNQLRPKQEMYQQQSPNPKSTATWTRSVTDWLGITKSGREESHKGFQVSRPRPLIVKSVSEFNGDHHGDDSDTGSLKGHLISSNNFSSSSQSSD